MHQQIIILTSLAVMSFSITANSQAQTRSTPVTVVNGASSPVVTQAVEYQYIGNTSEPTLPNIGLNNMHGLCANAFGTSARMCTSKEIFNTHELPDIPPYPDPTSTAWMTPSIMSSIVIGDTVHHTLAGGYALQESTASVTGNTCGGWALSNATAQGAAVIKQSNDTLFFGSGGACNQSFVIACCQPK